MSTLIKRPDNMVWDDPAGKWIPVGVNPEADFAYVINRHHFHGLSFEQELEIVQQQKKIRTARSGNAYLILLSLDFWHPLGLDLEFAEVLTLEFQETAPMFEFYEFRRLSMTPPTGFTAFDFGNNTFGLEVGRGMVSLRATIPAKPVNGGMIIGKESAVLHDFRILLSEANGWRELDADSGDLTGERSCAIAYPIARPLEDDEEEEVAGRAEDAWINLVNNGRGLADV